MDSNDDVANKAKRKMHIVPESVLIKEEEMDLDMVVDDEDVELKEETREELYKIRSSQKINSLRLFSRKYDFPKTFSLTENQFSGKTYFYTIRPWS